MKFTCALIFLFMSLALFAQDSRWIDLEWELVQDAREYEIELFQQEGDKVLPRGKYKTDSPQWSNAVSPGKYFLRLRSIDKRGVPGEWSGNIALKVRMQNPLQLRPAESDRISDPLVTFEWGPIEGADSYQLVVRNPDKEVIHNAATKELKASVYVDKLGEHTWSVFALEKGEDLRNPADLPESAFKKFQRAGGVLEAPKVGINLTDKVVLTWEKVRGARRYEVDYYPPPSSNEKNRRFGLKISPLSFPVEKLRDGITTLSIKATAEGYQDSNKSIVKIARNGNKVEIEDIVQGREVEEIRTPPTYAFFRNELFLAMTLSQFRYDSENSESDTKLSQSNLTGLGFWGEWNRRPSLNSLNRKTELSFLHLSSGIDSGYATRLAYSLNKEMKFSRRIFSFGAGLSYLGLPAFMGNLFDNKVEVKSSSSLGPELQLGFLNPLNEVWEIQTALILAYHPLYLSSAEDGAKAYAFWKVYGRVQRYYTEKQSFFGQIDYQSWKQEWTEDSSALSGVSLSFGLSTTF